MKKLISCFIGLVFLTGCFFSYDSSAELAQGKIVKIYVSPVVNETNQYGIEGDITRAIADEITNDGRLSFVNTPEESDEILSTVITGYFLEPLTYDAKMNVEQYKLEVNVKVEVRDSKANNVLWMQDKMNIVQVYRNDINHAGSLAMERQARSLAWEKVARGIVRSIIKDLALQNERGAKPKSDVEDGE